MMAGLFLLFFICMVLIFKQKRNEAIILTLVTLVLCLMMFMHHATDIIPIRL
jgi:fatty acid desaturase